MSVLPLRSMPRLGLATLLVAVVTTAAGAAPKKPVQYPIEDFLATTSMMDADFSADGSRILVSSDQSGVFNAYAIPVKGGAPVQLTKSTTHAIRGHAWYPKDDRFIYSSDQGGNELHHIYVQAPDGTVRDVTPGEGLKAMFLDWAADDQSFFIQTNERDKRYFDLYQVDPETLQRTLVYQNDRGLEPAAVSRDGQLVALLETRTEHDADVHLYDRRTKETKLLTQHTGEVLWEPEAFTPDGRSLLLRTDENNEFQYLVQHDLATGQRTVVEKPDWDVMDAKFSKSGKYMAVAINDDARTRIRVYEVAAHREVQLPKAPDGDVTAIQFANDDKRLAFYLSSSRMPSNLYVSGIGGGKAQRLTQNASPKIDPEHLVEGKVVRFKAADGVEIPGLLFQPLQAGADAKVPALVNVHGGPGGQSRLGYSGLVQFLVNHGYAVYSINNRGSSGYGKTFYKMDDRKHGEADLDDCVASKAMLAGTGWVDASRIGIMGGSYGGYMVLAALAFRPQEFNVGIDIFGVANWVRTLESIPSWWEAQRQALYQEIGDPTTDGEYLRRISPLFHADAIERPLLVLQGANDPRVLKVESDEMVAAAQKNGAVVEYVVFDDEGHGFRNKKNQLSGYQKILTFCDQYLSTPAQVGKR